MYRIWIGLHAHGATASISASHSRTPPVSTYPHWLAMASPFVHFAEKEVELLKRWQAEGIKQALKHCLAYMKYPTTPLVLQAACLRVPAPRNSCGPWGRPVDRAVDRSVDRCIFIGFRLWTVGPSCGPSLGPFRGPLYFHRFSHVDRGAAPWTVPWTVVFS